MFSLLLLLSAVSAGARTWIPSANEVDDALRTRLHLLPSSYDIRDAHFGCASTVVDQAQCGSCWAVSAASTLADRFCIHASQFGAGGSASQTLSSQPLVSCASTSNADVADAYASQGCNGGYQEEAWRFLTANGTSSMSASQHSGCSPYLSTTCDPDPMGDGCVPCAAAKQCMNSGEAPEVYMAGSAGAVVASSGVEDVPAQVAAIQREMYANGPVHACFDVYQNFWAFFEDDPQGVYNSSAGSDVAGGHCVKIVGWGESAPAKMPFWLIANSWGERWAQKGVFRYLRGVNLGGLEAAVWAACPADTICSLTPAVVKPSASPDAARGTGGMWHPVKAPLTGMARSSLDVVSDAMMAVHQAARLTRGRDAALLGAALSGGVSCAHTQVVNGLRVRLLIQPEDQRAHHVLATTLMAPTGGAHMVQTVMEVSRQTAELICGGDPTSKVAGAEELQQML